MITALNLLHQQEVNACRLHTSKYKTLLELMLALQNNLQNFVLQTLYCKGGGKKATFRANWKEILETYSMLLLGHPNLRNLQNQPTYTLKYYWTVLLQRSCLCISPSTMYQATETVKSTQKGLQLVLCHLEVIKPAIFNRPSCGTNV